MKYEDVEVGKTYYAFDRFNDIMKVRVYEKRKVGMYLDELKVVVENNKDYTCSLNSEYVFPTKKDALESRLKELSKEIEFKEEELENLKEEKEAVLNEMEYCDE